MYGPGYQGLGVAWIAMGFVFLLMIALGVTVIVLQYRLSQVRPLPGGGPAFAPATSQPGDAAVGEPLATAKNTGLTSSTLCTGPSELMLRPGRIRYCSAWTRYSKADDGETSTLPPARQSFRNEGCPGTSSWPASLSASFARSWNMGQTLR